MERSKKTHTQYVKKMYKNISNAVEEMIERKKIKEDIKDFGERSIFS